MNQNSKLGSRAHLSNFACECQSSQRPLFLDPAWLPLSQPLNHYQAWLIDGEGNPPVAAKVEYLGSLNQVQNEVVLKKCCPNEAEQALHKTHSPSPLPQPSSPPIPHHQQISNPTCPPFSYHVFIDSSCLSRIVCLGSRMHLADFTCECQFVI